MMSIAFAAPPLAEAWQADTEATPSAFLSTAHLPGTSGSRSFLAPALFVVLMPIIGLVPSSTPFQDLPSRRHGFDTEFSAPPPPALASWAVLTQISRSEPDLVADLKPSVTTEALRSFERIQQTLGLSSADTGRLVGISANTLRNWKQGKTTPYPSSTRLLFSVEATVTSLQRSLGNSFTEWLGRPLADGVAPREHLLKSDMPRFYRAASAVLYGMGPQLPPAGSLIDVGVEELDQPMLSDSARLDLFKGKVRARKKS
jgi:DNA-binding transcriptional regulator YiaG